MKTQTWKHDIKFNIEPIQLVKSVSLHYTEDFNLPPVLVFRFSADLMLMTVTHTARCPMQAKIFLRGSSRLRTLKRNNEWEEEQLISVYQYLLLLLFVIIFSPFSLFVGYQHVCLPIITSISTCVSANYNFYINRWAFTIPCHYRPFWHCSF